MRKLFTCLAVLAPVSLAMAQQPAPAPAPVAAAPAASAPATQAVDPNKVVLQVGDDKMTAAEFDAFIDALPDQVKQMASSPQGKRMLADRIVDLKLLANEARKRGIDQKLTAKMALQMAADQTLAQIMAEQVSKPDEAAIKADYEKNKGNYDQIKARHILIRTPDSEVPPNPNKKALTADEAKAKAEDIRNRIVNKKEDFATLAKAESDDTGSGQRGGDLGGYFSKGMMVPPFEEAAFALKPGEVSQPVKSKFGWHIIQLEDRKPSTLEEVVGRAAQTEGGKNLDELMKQLKASQPTKLDESFFGPANASAMPPGHPAVGGQGGGKPAGHP